MNVKSKEYVILPLDNQLIPKREDLIKIINEYLMTNILPYYDEIFVNPFQDINMNWNAYIEYK